MSEESRENAGGVIAGMASGFKAGHSQHYGQRHGQAPRHAVRQAEGETAAPSFLAFGVKSANIENPAGLLVLIDYAFTVGQSEPMAIAYLMVENARKLLRGHPRPVVLD